MEASFDTEESFDDPSCLAPQPPGSLSPARRQIKEVKETKITVSEVFCSVFLQVPVCLHPHLLTSGLSVSWRGGGGGFTRSQHLLQTASQATSVGVHICTGQRCRWSSCTVVVT